VLQFSSSVPPPTRKSPLPPNLSDPRLPKWERIPESVVVVSFVRPLLSFQGNLPGAVLSVASGSPQSPCEKQIFEINRMFFDTFDLMIGMKGDSLLQLGYR